MCLKIERGNIGVRRSGLDMIRIARTAQKGKFSHLATTAGFIAKPQIIILLLDCTTIPHKTQIRRGERRKTNQFNFQNKQSSITFSQNLEFHSQTDISPKCWLSSFKTCVSLRHPSWQYYWLQLIV